MGFFDRIRSFFSGPSANQRYLPIYIYSTRCRDAVAGRIDLMNELSGADADNAGAEPGAAGSNASAAQGAVFFVRKVVTTTGRDRCFDNVEVRVWLNANKQVVRHEVDGGMWLEIDEFERLEKARASTLEDDSPGGGAASDIDESEKPGGNRNVR